MESSASVESEITGGVAAVVDVFSDASIVISVERIELPASSISNVKVAPVGAVLQKALTSVTVNANGIRICAKSSATVASPSSAVS